jgi:type II secretory pathway component PulC
MNKLISTILPLLLITLVCVLAVEGFYTVVEKYLLAPVEKTMVISQVPERKQVAAVATQRTAEEDVRRVLERNLFGPPPSADKDKKSETQPTADLQPTTLSLVLMGTIISAGEENRAIILEKNKKNQDIYRQGEVVQGAVLKEILRKKVVLTYNNKDEILDMSEAGKYAGKVPPPGAAPPGPLPEPVLPGMEDQTNGQELPDSEPETIEAIESPPGSPPPGAPPRVIRPSRRIYTPAQRQPSQ